WCSNRAITSLPVPLSPCISTGKLLAATILNFALRASICSDLPKTIASPAEASAGRVEPICALRCAESWDRVIGEFQLFLIYDTPLHAGSHIGRAVFIDSINIYK